jgi:tRNA threonylcarbamoyladenosine biosynthesis protein TsaE
MRTLTTSSEAETAAAGRDLARELRPGAVVLLSGPLGAGKTAFVRGLAEGLGCDPDAISSPTFTIIQEYRGPVTLQHVDLYRLAPAEVDELGLDDLFEDQIAAVEWAERWRQPPADAVRVSIDVLDGDARRITVAS